MAAVLDPAALGSLAQHAARLPDKVAVVDHPPDARPRSWTFAELNQQANRLANVLLDLGVKPGDRVAWCGPNSQGIVVATHARAKLGVVGVPVNYRLTPAEAAYIIDNSDSVVIYVDAEHAQTFTSARQQMPNLRHIVTFGGPAPEGTLDGDALMAAASDADPGLPESEFVSLIYTSGTTGRPKGALRRAPDPAQAYALLQLVGHNPNDVYITTGPLYHSGPGGYLGVAHLLGNTAVLQRRFDPEDWLRLVDRYRVSMTFAAPTPIRMVCNLSAEVKARYDRSSMKRMIANAAPWSFALKEAYMADFGEDSLWEVYGSTELGVDTVLAPSDQRRKPGACGLPAPGVEIRLYDADANEVTQPGVPGEVYIRALSNFATYFKADDRAAEARRGDFATVGDIAYRDEDGYLYICDRKNDMIISGGMNIYPAEIEAALEQHPGVVEAAVFGIPDEHWGERVHAVVVARPDQTLSQTDITDFVRQHLAGYKVPRSISFMDQLPHTGSGKILKRELREPFWRGYRTRV